ncbi:cation:proton antiporter [Phormidesmis priestleyi]|uniref:cation:proton antiporter n=1 Tax=Phormidesmis priestleyi TaxID=268141 RepID=UPI00083B0081|nr:cation:proton antiporter [Phormidesmis priestleyi]
MQEDFRLIVDLVSVLAAAAAGGLFAALLKQPVLLGYLIAGVVVGPTGLGLIKEIVQVETLAQFGVAFLLFALGVEFSFSELKKVKAISLGGGGLQIALTISVTTLASLGLGWVTSPAQGVFLGAILSLSSTAVVLKCLMERNETGTPHGQVMLGILVVQDLALGLMLAVLPALDKPVEEIGLAVGWALLQTGLFALGAVAAGIWVIPPLLRLLAKTESRELFLLGVVAICLGIALLTEHLGLSIEMGAFVAGLMISEVEYADQTLTYVEPLRDIFAALFFASIGMLIDPFFLWNNLELILGLVAIVFVGKFLIITPLVRLFRYPLKTALIAGLGLAQIGEFSFVLASEGQSLGLVSRRVYLLILGTTAVTLVLTPFVLRLVPKLFTWAESLPLLKKYLEESDVPLAISDDLPTNHVVVCGYGQIGRNIVRLLQDRGYPVVVIDQSESRIQQARDAGLPYIYGNAASLHVLEKAGVAHAKGMAIALPDPMSTRLCLKRALEVAPDLDIVVRANQGKDIELLYQLGAREVVQPEFEASLELSAHLLNGVGLSLPAIQREVQQIRNSHYSELRPERPSSEISRELKAAAEEMNSKWYPLPEESPLTGMTLEEADIRQLTGVTLMAIRRAGGAELDYPDAMTTLEQGDRLLIVGESNELAAFYELAKGEAAVPAPNSSCQWIQVVEDSTIVRKTLSEIDWRRQYGIQIQAIRRENKFLRFPDDDMDVQAGDRLLLCGSFHSLNQATTSISPKLDLSVLPISMPSLNGSSALEEPGDR